jgi:hypothetical protein
MLGKHFPLLSVEEAERKSGMGNISLRQLKKQRGSQEWGRKYISLLSVKEMERKLGMGEEIYLSPVS